MKYKAGFIGCGNMGGVLLHAVIKNAGAENCSVCEKAPEKAEKFISLGATFLDSRELSKSSEFVFLAVKPQVMEAVVSELSDINTENTVFVTMAAGLEMTKIEGFLKRKAPIIRIMPNIPCSTGEGVLLYCCNELVTEEAKNEFLSLLSGVGLIDEIDEDKIDAASVVSGCGPAFVYLFADAIAKGARECGLDEEKAVLYAIRTLRGASFVMENSDKAIEELVRAVCSPKGSTIEGVDTLRTENFEDTVKKAVRASFLRTKELKKM